MMDLSDVEAILGHDTVAAAIEAVERALAAARRHDEQGEEALSTLITALLAMIVMEPREGAKRRASEYAACLVEAVVQGIATPGQDRSRLS